MQLHRPPEHTQFWNKRNRRKSWKHRRLVTRAHRVPEQPNESVVKVWGRQYEIVSTFSGKVFRTIMNCTFRTSCLPSNIPSNWLVKKWPTNIMWQKINSFSSKLFKVPLNSVLYDNLAWMYIEAALPLVHLMGTNSLGFRTGDFAGCTRTKGRTWNLHLQSMCSTTVLQPHISSGPTASSALPSICEFIYIPIISIQYWWKHWPCPVNWPSLVLLRHQKKTSQNSIDVRLFIDIHIRIHLCSHAFVSSISNVFSFGSVMCTCQLDFSQQQDRKQRSLHLMNLMGK